MKITSVFRIFGLWCLLLGILLFGAPQVIVSQTNISESTKQVYKITIDGTIDRGLAPFVQRVLEEA